MAGTGRGLSIEDIKSMEIGAFVDYIIEWNEWNDPDEKKEKKKEQRATKRKATQADWDAFFGV